jgi:SAM-dependent methyltransferase
MLVTLICPNCRTPLKADHNEWKCPGCQAVFTLNQGTLSFLSPAERFNESVYQEKQINAWTTSARLRDRVRASKLLTTLNNVRIDYSLSGRRDRLFRREFKSRGRNDFLILDIGCGGGRHYYCDYGKVVGIDPVLPLLQMAGKIYDEVYQCSGFSLPFQDATFDYIVSTDVLGHVDPKDKDKLFAEFHRVLKPGGRAVHCIEADSVSPWFRFAHKYPDLFHVSFVDRPGHIGLELPSEWRARFLRHGFKEITFDRLSSRVQEPGTVAAWFDNEYKTKSKTIRALVTADRLLAKSFAVKEVLNFALEPLAKLDDWMTPLDYAWCVLVVYEKV